MDLPLSVTCCFGGAGGGVGSAGDDRSCVGIAKGFLCSCGYVS